MRIISGIYKKKIILPPKNFKLRPTTDIAKEALFNIIYKLIFSTRYSKIINRIKIKNIITPIVNYPLQKEQGLL